MEIEEDQHDSIDMQMTSASTTIDPSVVQSRIRQSMSLQKEDSAAMDTSDGAEQSQQPIFPQLSAAQANGNKVEYRRVRCPPHRYTPLREHWEQILTPLVEYLKLQVRSLYSSCWNVLKLLVLPSRGRKDPTVGMCLVLFLELQTLQEASMV